MDTNEHTPGPLVVRHELGDYEWDGRCFTVYEDRTGRATLVALCAGPRAEANAHLFRAAPDLLAALKTADSYFNASCPYDKSEGFQQLRHRATAAIALAKVPPAPPVPQSAP